jgi:hypothetical protein
LDHICEREQIVTRRAEAMEQHDDWAVPATMPVYSTGEANLQSAHYNFPHVTP